MVFAGLLGAVKAPRRHTSAGSGSDSLRPGSSSSGTRQRSRSGRKEHDVETKDKEKYSSRAASAAELDNFNAQDAASIFTPDTTTASSSSPSSLGPEYISDESQLAPLSPETPDLRELNNSLEALAVVFPDVQVDVFREMLTSFEGESRLALVADALLKNRVTWVKGRWRVADKEGGANTREERCEEGGNQMPSSSSSSCLYSSPPAAISTADRFRTPEYKKAAQALACHEFMGLTRSTIHAVLAEQNYAYLDARRALVQMSSKSWRFTLSSLFLRRKPVTCTEAENHPLIVWKSSGQGSIIPTIKATGSAELDRELYGALIAPLLAQQRATQVDSDRTLAATLNTAEAEAADATFECTCCFSTAAFEEVTTCNSGDATHIVCFRCVQHSVREAVFGQGWARTIDTNRGTLRCPAVDSTDCEGVIPVDHLHRALLDEKRGADVLHHLERRLAEHSLVGSGLPLVRCPFCEYAEVDDIYVPFREAPLRVRVDSLYSLAFLLLLFGVTPLLMMFVVVLLVLASLLPGFLALPAVFTSVFQARIGARAGNRSTEKTKKKPPSQQSYLGEQFAAAVTRFRRRRRGQQFRCQNPACGRASCLSCGKAWADIHVCHESSLVALRTQVEQAMSMAIKRVCPRCHTSFVKTAGCNKLTCPCGYKMCYVCRKDISGHDGPDAGYRHFCEHFRPHGDGRACSQCRKCNLWESEDTEAVLQAARDEAERRWRETERRELSLSERAYLETGIALAQPPSAKGASATAAGTVTARRLVGSMWRPSDKGQGEGGEGGEGGGGGVGGGGGSSARLPTLAEALDWLLESVLV